MAKRIPGEFVPLDVTLPRKPAIRQGGPDVELLFIRSLVYLGTSNTEGWLPRYDLEVWSAGLRAVPKSIKHLVATELWTEVEGGWYVPSWPKWNRSKEERGEIRDAKKAGALKTNHGKGYHADEPNPDCAQCIEEKAR